LPMCRCDRALFFFSSRRRHTRFSRDWSSDVCSSDLVERAITFARGGDPVVMFPEGTRRLPGRQIKHHTGAARVALEAGVPLIPAGISGTDRLNRLGAQRVLYGPPVDLDDLKGMPRRDGAVEGTRRLMEAIHRLEAQLAGGKGR